MPILTDVKIRQPARNDLVGEHFVVAGVGSGFEGTIGLRVLGPRGRVVGTGSAQSSAGMIGIGEFSTTVELSRAPRPRTGHNPGLPDEGPSPGFNLTGVDLIFIPGLRGWQLYRVERGDTLTSIARAMRDLGRPSVARIVAANPRLTDPDHIEVGQRIRIPITV